MHDLRHVYERVVRHTARQSLHSIRRHITAKEGARAFPPHQREFPQGISAMGRRRPL